MGYNYHKINELFKARISEIERDQKKELEETKQKFADQNSTRSGIFISAIVELYQKHLRERLDCFIEAAIETFNDNEYIKDNATKKIIKDLWSHLDSQLKFKQNDLSTLITAIGLHRAGIGSGATSGLQSKFNEIRNVKTSELRHRIEKHNQEVSLFKKKNGFWNSKSGTISAFAAVVMVIFTILSYVGMFEERTPTLFPTINSFVFSDSQVTKGKVLRIEWEVSNADSVILNPGNYLLPLSGSKNLRPNSSTTFTLSVFLNNKITFESKSIIVKDSSGVIL